jgi:ectoine hydroxylase-related dioxygenase (phytanoyl-CoA dioxygenase family)
VKDRKPPKMQLGPSGFNRMVRQALGQGKMPPKDMEKAWLDDGFVVMPNVFTPEQIARYNAIVAKVRSEVDDGKDAQGFGDRIGQLHQKEPALLELASSPKIVDFLEWALGDEPVVMGSLQFQKGSEQNAHIDAIFFWPDPAYSMAGVWIALEDIHEDAGPLYYIPGSHRWPFYRSEDIVRSRPELAKLREAARRRQLSGAERASVVSQIGNAWTDDFLRLEAEHQSRRVTICPKAGDVVIWHSLLAHGGAPRRDLSRSRLSTVFHYLGKRANLYTFDQFMLYDRADLLRQSRAPSIMHRHCDVRYMRFPQFVTYSSGREIIHPL